MKKSLKIIAIAAVALVGLYLCLPPYLQKAVIHLYPTIDDREIFERDTLHAPAKSRAWAHAADYNRYRLTPEEETFLDHWETTAFLVIQHDSIVFESYRNGGDAHRATNLFSGTKSIVSLLTGIAWGDGKIKSLDDPVSDYLPEYKEGNRNQATIRHLLTMSADLDWDEAYTSPFSITTQGYYGNNLRELVMKLGIGEPGRQFSYRSGETQILAFVVEAATGHTLSKYAEEKLWRPLQAENDAYWLLDRKGGDEKAFCCFHTTARDVARLGRLILHNGDWYGRQIVPAAYMQEAISPASYLQNQWGDRALDYYGFQFWILRYHDKAYPYMRGMLGQYIMAIPERDALFVRLGHQCDTTHIREANADIFSHLDLVMNILGNRE